MVLQQYGPEWRHYRKLTHAALNTDAVKKFSAVQEQHVRTFLATLLDRPEDFVHNLRL
jgi:cytochrome P450